MLENCLSYIQDTDLWKIAESDYKSVSPFVVKQFLNKFNFKKEKATGLVMQYSDWVNGVLVKQSPEFIAAYNNNTNLQNYLKGLVSIARNNPEVISNNNAKVKFRSFVPQFIEDMNIKKKRVDSSVDTSYRTVVRAVEGLFPLESGNMYRSMMDEVMAGDSSNTHFILGSQNFVPTLTGGSKNFNSCRSTGVHLDGTCSDSNTLGNVVLFISNALNQMGQKLREEDKQALLNSIQQINDLEEKVGKALKLLKNYVDTARVNGVDLSEEDKSLQDLSFTSVNTNDKMKDLVRDQIKKTKEVTKGHLKDLEGVIGKTLKELIPSILADCGEGKKTVTKAEYRDEDYVLFSEAE
jgi:hypothetical protein